MGTIQVSEWSEGSVNWSPKCQTLNQLLTKNRCWMATVQCPAGKLLQRGCDQKPTLYFARNSSLRNVRDPMILPLLALGPQRDNKPTLNLRSLDSRVRIKSARTSSIKKLLWTVFISQMYGVRIIWAMPMDILAVKRLEMKGQSLDLVSPLVNKMSTNYQLTKHDT